MTVTHDEAHHRFVAAVDGSEAELAYARPDPRTIDLQHTEVPESGRGKGVAAALANAAFAYAREHRLHVIPTCPFIRQWLRRHPEQHDMLANKLQ